MLRNIRIVALLFLTITIVLPLLIAADSELEQSCGRIDENTFIACMQNAVLENREEYIDFLLDRAIYADIYYEQCGNENNECSQLLITFLNSEIESEDLPAGKLRVLRTNTYNILNSFPTQNIAWENVPVIGKFDVHYTSDVKVEISFLDESAQITDNPTNSDNHQTRTPTGETSIPPLPLFDANCGRNEHFVKVCYTWRHTNPKTPTSQQLQTEIYQFTREHKDETNGFVVISIPEPLGADDYAIARRGVLEQEVRASLLRLKSEKAIDKMVPVASFVSKTEGEDNEKREVASYIFSSKSLQQYLAQVEGLSEEQQVVNELQEAFSKDLDQLSVKAWEDLRTSYEEDRVEIIRKIKEELKIDVRILYSPTPWEVESPISLAIQLCEFLKDSSDYYRGQFQQCGVITNDDGNLLNAEEFTNYVFETMREPCVVYLLVDRQGAYYESDNRLARGSSHIYQSQHCGLKAIAAEISDADAGKEDIILLKSALRNTQVPDPNRLLLAAYGEVLAGNIDYGISLGQYAIDNFPRKNEQEEKTHISNFQIITFYDQLQSQTDAKELFETAKSIRSTIPYASTPFQGHGAFLAIEAAGKSKQCQFMHEVLTEYRVALRSSQDLNKAAKLVDACEEQLIFDTCHELEAGKVTGKLEILFVNDGMPQTDFIRARNEIRSRLLKLEPLNRLQNDIVFREVQSTGSIVEQVQVSGPLLPPKVDTNLLQKTLSVCTGDIALVISDENFYPVTVNSAGLISTDGCNFDENAIGSGRCMNIYASRALGTQVFELEKEDNSVLGILNRDPAKSTVLEMFSLNQRDQIQEWWSSR